MSDVGGMESKEYLMDYVGMKSNWDAYFQAGVLLFGQKIVYLHSPKWDYN